MDAFIGLASPFLAALLEGVDADVSDLERHLDLLYFVSRATHVVCLV